MPEAATGREIEAASLRETDEPRARILVGAEEPERLVVLALFRETDRYF